MEIKIKYFNEDYPRLEKIEQGDWIDLRVDRIDKIQADYYENITDDVAPEFITDGTMMIESGDVIKFGLGVAMELPDGYEAVIVPRSSTFKSWGLIQTNSQGVIDNSYSGDNDEWLLECVAMRDSTIERFDRVCQFRIQKKQTDVVFNEVKKLLGPDRGGYGTTGRQ